MKRKELFWYQALCWHMIAQFGGLARKSHVKKIAKCKGDLLMSTKTKIFSWAYEFWKFPWQIQKKDTKKQQKKKAFISFSVKNTQLIIFCFGFCFFWPERRALKKIGWKQTKVNFWKNKMSRCYKKANLNQTKTCLNSY